MPFAIAIFTSAFLIFQVQPVIARYILPWYGGSPAVWTTCMMFFQAGLLAGYGYSHFISRKFNPRTQAMVHILLLAASLVFLPITPDESLKPTGTENPIAGIILLLLRTAGVPYILLSATGPLLQNWFRLKHAGKSPYRLYALSNLGSLLGLLTYPFLIEPNFPLRTQTVGWSWGHVAFIALCGICAWMIRDTKEEREEIGVSSSVKKRREYPSLWVLLSFGGSLFLLASTNKICQDVAVIPFLWILPLSLYLLTFIIAFDSPAWYDRRIWVPLFLVMAVLQICILFSWDWFQIDPPILLQVGVYAGGMFSGCLVMHGEMARLKPEPSRLTYFFFLTSLGGALGGLFVNFLVPALFRGYWEFHTSLIIAFLVPAIVFFLEWRHAEKNRWRLPLLMTWTTAGIAVSLLLIMNVFDFRSDVIASTRNFYGVLRVVERHKGEDNERRDLYHGVINHGLQFSTEERKRKPTTYYGPYSGAGLAIRKHPSYVNCTEDTLPCRPMKVGMIGLGTGTIAAYGREGDSYLFYEINPMVTEFARRYFSYLSDCRAKVDVVEGDGRISLEHQFAASGNQGFDVLAIDAFSGDAIPVHLLTREALDLYFKNLKPDGILAFHITNRYINLRPVLRKFSEVFGMKAMLVEQYKDDAEKIKDADWVLMTRNEKFLSHHRMEDATDLLDPEMDDKIPAVLWTDDYSSILPLIE